MPKLKDQKLRHNEYYDMQTELDNLYAKSKDNAVFRNLMKLIQSEKISSLHIGISKTIAEVIPQV